MNKRFLLLAIMLVVMLAMFAPAAFAGKPPSVPSPTVTITAPANGATVSGTAVAISANCASGGTGYTVTGATYRIGNGSEVAMSGPNGSASGTWTASWNSTTVANGNQTITVTATNSGGKTTSQNVTVNVQNGATNPHENLLWSGYPSNCRSCHASQFSAMYGALHYQWQATAPDNINSTALQGKVNSAINAYCVNINGNWGAQCGFCHVGRGAEPVMTNNPTTAQLDNIDCLMCHNESYALGRVRLSTTSLGPPAGTAQATLDGYVRNVGKPTRKTCLKCHAYGGGGDGLKRGDVSSMLGATTDGNHDVHMSTSRGNLPCQACHKFVNHKVTGKGSDLQSTDHAAEIKCATSECHSTRQTGGHTTTGVDKHIARVACQTCHVPLFGKGIATEMERDWRVRKANGHPSNIVATNVTPVYKFWNRKTWNYLKGNNGRYNATTGAWETVQLQGSIAGDTTNKLYAFKYKISYAPLRTTGNMLIALDTNEYLNLTGDYFKSVIQGLTLMGFPSTDAWTTAKADTYQMLNHTIADAQSNGGVLGCSDCHENTSRMNLVGALGYNLKNTQTVICSQCHNSKRWKGYTAGHSRHVDTQKFDCSWCHSFSRPERGLTMP